MYIILTASDSSTVLQVTAGGVHVVGAGEGVDAIDSVKTSTAEVLHNSCPIGSGEPEN